MLKKLLGTTIIIEIDGPFQPKLDRYESETIVRYVWLWFAVSKLKVSFREFSSTAYYWGENG